MSQQQRFTLRTYSRFPAQMSMMYLGPDFAGQGTMRELSRVGCRAVGNYPVVSGDILSIRISLPTHPTPLVIDQATVQWVKGLEYGVAFEHVDERNADRLQELLDEFLDLGSYREAVS